MSNDSTHTQPGTDLDDLGRSPWRRHMDRLADLRQQDDDRAARSEDRTRRRLAKDRDRRPWQTFGQR